ncbi:MULTISPECIES: transglycosylase SLT domain-containing protein [unclassified Meiothermus]|uniref:transglycosylase SLT domain-containing protein n=1 Tax=unclassified Meiothermus TaxID=370471 RepID=UPI000D7CBFAF|nr:MULTISPECIES: transglycosylase SLT domain-containing protein [unclassified Meiothermus]PZA07179.1 transglycosylase [Meiothermus sp. Pnk-1]RYM39938.1 transglycosylase [Meiothermus sp. PNK-Is4]
MRWGLLLLVLLALGCRGQQLPGAYQELERALQQQDLLALASLAADPGFAGLVAARTLAADPTLSALERAPHALAWARFLEQSRAFEPGFTPRTAWAQAAPLLEAAGMRTEAIEAYTRLLPAPEAVSGLRRLTSGDDLYHRLYAGKAYEALVEVLPEGVRPDLRAPALYRLGRYREAIPAYREWSKTDPKGLYGLGWSLYLSNQQALGIQTLARYDLRESRFAQGAWLQSQGQIPQAIAAYRESTPEGQWRAAGLLEQGGRLREALLVYLQLARPQPASDRSSSPASFRDDAAYRAWVLARQIGAGELERQAYTLLGGGLAVLAGKPLEPKLAPALPPLAQEPSAIPIARALAQHGKTEWARGELRYALLQTSDPSSQLALLRELQALGAYRETIRSARELPPSRAVLEVVYPRAYAEWVEKYAQANGLEPSLLWGLMWQESHFDPQAVSRTGAQGLLQFTRPTWEDVARMLGETSGDRFDPETSIRYGARYLRWLYDRCTFVDEAERWPCAVLAYNGGIGYVRRGIEASGSLKNFLRFQEREEPREFLPSVLEAYAYYHYLY